jgi:hypothetical protein
MKSVRSQEANVVVEEKITASKTTNWVGWLQAPELHDRVGIAAGQLQMGAVGRDSRRTALINLPPLPHAVVASLVSSGCMSFSVNYVLLFLRVQA